MATKYWLGVADPVAQVATVQITAFDAATTYRISIGGVIVSVPGNTNANTTASDLQVALEASTHPYFTGITFTVNTDTVTMTATTAGAPFTATSSVTGGTGTIGSVTAVTASAGPNDWSTADNWSDGSVPGSSDTVYFRESSINVCWGLDQSAVAINNLFIEKTYTGKIGLNRAAFATSSDGDTVDTSKPEYRDTYLQIDVDTVEIGKHVGGGTAVGSGRIKIDNTNSGACNTFVFATASVAAETTLAAVRLLFASSTANLNVRGGSVGVAIDEPTETSTVQNVKVNGRSAAVFLGAGVTVTNYSITDGNALVQAAATITAVDVEGGITTIEGDFTITALTIDDGVCYCNNIKTAGNAISTLNANGGIMSAIKSSAARTWATVNLGIGATLQANPANLTITTLNEPSNVEYSLTTSA